MAESKFTPGPWSVQDGVRRDSGLGYRIIGPCGVIVGFTQSAMCREDYFGFTKANAELMADALRMLEVIDTLYDCIDHETLLPSQLDAYHQARELLAKHGG